MKVNSIDLSQPSERKPQRSFPTGNTVEQIDYYIVENEKSARKFIKITPKKAQPVFMKLDKYTDELETRTTSMFRTGALLAYYLKQEC